MHSIWKDLLPPLSRWVAGIEDKPTNVSEPAQRPEGPRGQIQRDSSPHESKEEAAPLAPQNPRLQNKTDDDKYEIYWALRDQGRISTTDRFDELDDEDLANTAKQRRQTTAVRSQQPWHQPETRQETNNHQQPFGEQPGTPQPTLEEEPTEFQDPEALLIPDLLPLLRVLEHIGRVMSSGYEETRRAMSANVGDDAPGHIGGGDKFAGTGSYQA